jgi:hypothetical protein
MKAQHCTVWLVVLAAALARAGQPAPQGDRGGTVDLEFGLHTRPGGPPGPLAVGVSTINVHLSISAHGVAVDKDGKFSFEAQGIHRFDSFSNVGGVTVQNNEQCNDSLIGTGTFAADGTLSLKLEWRHGAGLLIYTVNGTPYSVQQPASAEPHVMEWTVAPTSQRVEELGPDVRRKISDYRSQRPAPIPGSRAAQMDEGIEVRRVRYEKLVPRG